MSFKYCTRPVVFSLLCGCLLFSLKCFAKAAKGESPSSGVIYIAPDLHYISPSLTDNGSAFLRILENGDGKVTQYIQPLTQAFLSEVLEGKPDLVILPGDLTFNGELQSHIDLARQLKVITDHGIRVLVMPGNHDLLCASAHSYEKDQLQKTPTAGPKDFRQIYHDFGYEDALSVDEWSLSYIYPLSDTLRILFIDTNTPDAPGLIKPETINWVRKQLIEAQKDGAYVISCSHQNLLPHNSIFIDGFRMGNSASLLELYHQYHVQLNLSGHMHLQHISLEEAIDPETLEKTSVCDISTSALCVSPCQYGILTWDGNEWNYQTKAVDVSSWAEKQPSGNPIDPALLDFSSTAAEFFDLCGRKKLIHELELTAPKEQTVEQSYEAWGLLSDTLRLNADYIAGRLQPGDEDEARELLDRWQTLRPSSFYIVYLLSILKEPFQDMNHAGGSF